MYWWPHIGDDRQPVHVLVADESRAALIMMPIMRIIFSSSLCAMSDQRIPELYTSPHTPTAPREKLNPKEHNPKEENPKGENPKELWKEPQIYYSLLAGSMSDSLPAEALLHSWRCQRQS